jgi:hypothetical protein
MKLSHTAALTLAGWYLLVPLADNNRVFDELPIWAWKTAAIFDTARECQEALLWGKAQPAHHLVGITLDAYKRRQRASICIASDDPRLKGK